MLVSSDLCIKVKHMELYGQYSRSLPQKIIIHVIEVMLIWLSYRILFEDGGAWIGEHTGIGNTADSLRRIIIFAFNIAIFLRLGYMMFFLMKRKIPWEESISVPFAFAIYYLGFSVLVLPASEPVDVLDVLAIMIFILGCVLNTLGEVLRHRWKKKPENKGSLYTGGFFRYSRHINYFGDLLWVTAYAIITRNIWSGTVPVSLFLFFAFYNAPKLDQHLKEKYGADYDEYAKNTKMLIPGIY